MKNNNLKITYFLLFSYLGSYQASLGNINLFIRPYPQKNASPAQKLEEQLNIPGRITHKTIKNTFITQSPQMGIFATYWGYLALSGFNGLLTFPRKQQKENFNVLITTKIDPIFMIGNTIHHWEIDRSVLSQLYTVTQRQDPTTKQWLWETKEADLPKDNIITLNTIVLFAKPQNIYVPLGITLTQKNPQLLLPDIYVKKDVNIPARALWVLLVRQFFGPLHKVIKKESPTYFSEHLNVK